MGRWEVPYYWTLPAAGPVCFVIGFPVRLPGAAPQGLPGARDLCARGRRAAVLKFEPLSPFYRRRAGDRGPETRPAVRCRSPGPVALLLLPGRSLWPLFAVRLEPRAGPHTGARSCVRDHPIAARRWASTWRGTRHSDSASAPSTPGLGALGGSWCSSSRPTASRFPLDHPAGGRVVGGLASFPGAIFGGVFMQFVPASRSGFQGGALGDLRRVPDRLHVPHALWCLRDCCGRYYTASRKSIRQRRCGPDGIRQTAPHRETSRDA